MKKLYAAYGSNLNLRQMAYRCPDAAVVGTARLEDYELVFRGGPGCGVATVEPRAGSSVPILLWEISAQDEKNLDRYEGWPLFYGKRTLGFAAEGQTLPAMVYVMTPGRAAALLDARVAEIVPTGEGTEVMLAGVEPEELVRFNREYAEHLKAERAMGLTMGQGYDESIRMNLTL